LAFNKLKGANIMKGSGGVREKREERGEKRASPNGVVLITIGRKVKVFSFKRSV